MPFRERNDLQGGAGSSGGVAHRFKLNHLRVEVYGLPEYWMHLQVRADALLEELDHFLRDIWLECCWHPSAFTMEERRYASDPIGDLDEMDMKISMGEILGPGMKFLHEFDCGTTTELILKVVSENEKEVEP